jgi:homoserine kinase
MKQDYDLIGRSLEDVIIEPVRSMLIPGFDEGQTMLQRSRRPRRRHLRLRPSIFMLSKDEATATRSGRAS